MSKRAKIWLIALIFGAAFLRFQLLFANTFHSDEALFALWARLIAVWRDPLLQSQLVDKPPLLFYLQALFYPLLGPVEFAARLPNFIGSLFLVPLTGMLAWRLFRDELAAILSAAFITFSPLLIQFSATAFLDPFLTFLLVASLYFTSCYKKQGENRSNNSKNNDSSSLYLSGIFFALAVATKHQAWLFLPLIVGLAAINRWRWKQWKNWLIGFLPIIFVLVTWGLVRSEQPSIWSAQLNAFGGLRLSWSWELWPRFDAWFEQWSYLLYSPVIGFFVLLAVPPFIAMLIHHEDRATYYDLLLVIFVVAYFVFHWLIAVPIWDRYILPIAPLVALILARFVSRSIAFVSPSIPATVKTWPAARRMLWLVPLILLAIQAQAVIDARAGQLPIGGQPYADGGVLGIADALSDAQYGTVLYDHWYSWQWRYHFFDEPVYTSWFPTPSALVEDLLVFADGNNPRYIVLPDGDTSLPVKRKIDALSFKLVAVETVLNGDEKGSMTLYQIVKR